MRTLIVGAGALGGYFGGRLLQAKRDVTFLVRPRRAAELEKTGLIIRSPAGDAAISPVPYTLAEKITSPFDVVVVACKAYDLAATMESFAPAVGPDTAIVPLLNGMRHLDQLSARFGEQRVLGGQCLISATLDQNGAVLHFSDLHTLAFGERDGSRSPRVDAIAAAFGGANFHAHATDIILQEMWEKWIFIATLAGITCLMRAAIGDIVAAGATDLARALYGECVAIATREGHPPRAAAAERSRTILTAPGTATMASMLRDIERHAPTEADHIIGDLLGRGADQSLASPLLTIVQAHLKSYDARRLREAESAASA